MVANGGNWGVCPGYHDCRIALTTNCFHRPPLVALPCLRDASVAALRAAQVPIRDEHERERMISEIMERAAGRGSRSAVLRATPTIKLLTLLVSIARNVWREHARGLARMMLLRSLDPGALDVQVDPGSPDATSVAAARETLARIRIHGASLPPPCREIALRLTAGFQPHEICPFLRAWRAVGGEECRRLIRLTKAMLRALERGQSARTLWPAGWEPKKNLWATTPPPQKITNGIEGAFSSAPHWASSRIGG